jgi:hypothetical protein
VNALSYSLPPVSQIAMAVDPLSLTAEADKSGPSISGDHARAYRDGHIVVSFGCYVTVLVTVLLDL